MGKPNHNSGITSKYINYSQSANTLYNFMNKFEYLKDILISKTIVPRYCIEDIKYLNINFDGVRYEKIAVLQKCFCDIFLPKLTNVSETEIIGGDLNNFTEQEIEKFKNNSHLDFYGKYGIAFHKEWGENNNLQPVQYINERSNYAIELVRTLNYLLNDSTVSEICTNDVINRLSHIKPLRGNIIRTINDRNKFQCKIEFLKNFHDEQEWRYVPNIKILNELELEPIIANPNILKQKNIDIINTNLASKKFRKLWLNFEYDDIKYIIVPNKQDRIDVINSFLSTPNFKNISVIKQHIITSKILVLDEIRRDW